MAGAFCRQRRAGALRFCLSLDSRPWVGCHTDARGQARDNPAKPRVGGGQPVAGFPRPSPTAPPNHHGPIIPQPSAQPFLSARAGRHDAHRRACGLEGDGAGAPSDACPRQGASRETPAFQAQASAAKGRTETYGRNNRLEPEHDRGCHGLQAVQAARRASL